MIKMREFPRSLSENEFLFAPAIAASGDHPAELVLTDCGGELAEHCQLLAKRLNGRIAHRAWPDRLPDAAQNRWEALGKNLETDAAARCRIAARVPDAFALRHAPGDEPGRAPGEFLSDLFLLLEPVVFYLPEAEATEAVALMRAGAFMVLTQSTPPEELQALVQQALQASAEELKLARLYAHLQRSLDRLTPRRRVVLQEVIAGAASKQIAEKLGVSKRLVELERSEILKAFDAETSSDVTYRVGQLTMLHAVAPRVAFAGGSTLRIPSLSN